MKIEKFSTFEAVKTPCQTPDAKFTTEITKDKISITIDLPSELDINEDEAKILEANIHNAMEMVLAKYFI